MDLSEIKISGNPFEKKVMFNAISRRNIVKIGVGSEELYEIIVSAIYEDENGNEWIQGINVADIIDGKEVPDVSNIVIRLDNITMIEFSDRAVYNLQMDAKTASSIMHRTDRIVKSAKQLILGDEYDENYNKN